MSSKVIVGRDKTLFLEIEQADNIQSNSLTETLNASNDALVRFREVIDDESFHETAEFTLNEVNDPLVLCQCAELSSLREPSGMYYRALLWARAWDLLRISNKEQNQNSQFWWLCNKLNVSIKIAKYCVTIGEAIKDAEQKLSKYILRAVPSQIFHNAYLYKSRVVEYLIDASNMLQKDPNATPTQIHTKWCRKNGSIKANLDIIKPSDWWAFSHPKWRKDEDFNGSIPGEIYANALYYFAPQKGIAVDPMAGSGMLKRVYDDRERWQKSSNFDLEIHLFDLFPKRDFITKHDARIPLPLKADWIFIDPPYFGQANHLYEGELALTTNYEDYLSIMKMIVISLAQSLNFGGRLCIFLPKWSGLNLSDPNYDVPHDIYLLALESGLNWIDCAFVSRGRQQEPGSAAKNNAAKRSLRMRSDTCILNVFEKRG